VASTPPAVRRRSPYARLLSDRRGELRTSLILILVAAALAMLTLGSFAALLAAGAGSPETLAVWVIAAFLLIKLPLLGGVWWILSRRREHDRGGGWSASECAEILGYLEREARASVGRPDAPARLRYFAQEAWFVADAATDADKPAAVATAIAIDGLAAEAAGSRPGGPAEERPPG
jgi:hypothetical protein